MQGSLAPGRLFCSPLCFRSPPPDTIKAAGAPPQSCRGSPTVQSKRASWLWLFQGSACITKARNDRRCPFCHYHPSPSQGTHSRSISVILVETGAFYTQSQSPRGQCVAPCHQKAKGLRSLTPSSLSSGRIKLFGVSAAFVSFRSCKRPHLP